MELSILEGFLEEAKGGYAFQWEEPYCKSGKILLWGRCGCWTASLCGGEDFPQAFPGISVAGAEPFLGSAGGGWWADFLWNLCLGPLPGTIFL